MPVGYSTVSSAHLTGSGASDPAGGDQLVFAGGVRVDRRNLGGRRGRYQGGNAEVVSRMITPGTTTTALPASNGRCPTTRDFPDAPPYTCV